MDSRGAQGLSSWSWEATLMYWGKMSRLPAATQICKDVVNPWPQCLQEARGSAWTSGVSVFPIWEMGSVLNLVGVLGAKIPAKCSTLPVRAVLVTVVNTHAGARADPAPRPQDLEKCSSCLESRY